MCRLTPPLLLLIVHFAASQREIWYPDGACGISKYEDAGEPSVGEARIVGGEEARRHEFPWQVSIQTSGLFGDHFCGGSIIHPDWVVASSYCMEGQTVSSLRVIVGEHDSSESNVQNSVRETHNVDYVFMHEEYNYYSLFDADISLLKLSSSIEFSEDVTAICAPDMSADYRQGQLMQISGWGTTNMSMPCCEDVLRWADVYTLDNPTCQDYENVAAPLTDGMVCAGDNGGFTEKDVCQGDRGGPMSHKSATGDFELVGVTSWGFRCAGGSPHVYANVQQYAEWITSKMEKN